MSKKAPPPGQGKGKGSAKPPPIPVARELEVDVDLRRLLESSNLAGDGISNFMKRAKSELLRVKEGEQEDIPQFVLFVSDKISYNEARALFTIVLPPYPYLRVVQLHHCGLDDDSMLFLVEFVRSYKPTPDRNPFGIRILEIPGSKITARGAGYIGKMMSENSTIERLVIDFTPLGDDGAKALCEGLRWNGTLLHLSMQYCGITAGSADIIASRVIKGSNVRHLSLRGNLLEGPGVKELGSALSVGTKIEELDLADTGFGFFGDAIEVLCEGIESNSSLSVINLDLNTLVPLGPVSLLAAIKKNRRIVSMPISERMEAAIYNEILDVLAQNKKEADKERKRKAKKGK